MADARSALLDAAMALFLEKGFDDTAMEQVRQQAGVSNGSLYHHFPTKNHLARALYEQTLHAYHAAMLEVIRADPEAEVGVRGLVGAHMSWVADNPRGARVLHELRRTTAISGAEPDWGALNAEAFRALHRWCKARMDAGEMRALPFPVWIALVFAPMLALTPQWTRPGGPRLSPELRQAMGDAAWNAVQPSVPAKRTRRTSRSR